MEIAEPSGTGTLGQTTGKSYRLGPTARRERGRLVSLGEALFSAGGMFRALESSGALLYDALGRDGRWLTSSLAASCSGVPVSPAEVFAAAQGLLRSEKLVASHLERLVDLGLATRAVSRPGDQPRHSAHGLETLEIVAAEKGWETRYQRLERHISNEQLGLTSITVQIRELPCCYCGREGRGCILSGRMVKGRTVMTDRVEIPLLPRECAEELAHPADQRSPLPSPSLSSRSMR